MLLDTTSSFLSIPDKSCNGCKQTPRFSRQDSTSWREGSGESIRLGQTEGKIGIDSVSFGDGTQIVNNTNIFYLTAQKKRSWKFNQYQMDGSLGLLPASLQSYPATFLEQLLDQRLIGKKTFTVQLSGQQSNVLLGGYDYSTLRKFAGSDKLTVSQLEDMIEWIPAGDDWAFEPSQIWLRLPSDEQVEMTAGVQFAANSTYSYLPQVHYDRLKAFINDTLKEECNFFLDKADQPTIVCQCRPTKLEKWPDIEFIHGEITFAFKPERYLQFEKAFGKILRRKQDCTVQLRPSLGDKWLLGSSFLRHYIQIYEEGRIGLFPSKKLGPWWVPLVVYLSMLVILVVLIVGSVIACQTDKKFREVQVNDWQKHQKLDSPTSKTDASANEVTLRNVSEVTVLDKQSILETDSNDPVPHITSLGNVVQGSGAMIIPTMGDKRWYYSQKPRIEEKAGEKFNYMEPVGYNSIFQMGDKSKIVGTMYRVKYRVEYNQYIHVRMLLKRDLSTLQKKEPEILSVEKNQSAESKFGDF